MDDITYTGGLWTGAGIAVQTLLADIMEAAGIPYEIDVALNDIAVVGWLPVCTLREALQQIAFAVGASVDCSRSWAVKIYESRLASVATATATITKAQKGTPAPVSQKPIVAIVEVTAHSMVASDEGIELFSGTLAAGTYTILFSQPAHTLSISGATISSSGVNYAVIAVAAPGAVVLQGQSYIDYKSTFQITNPAVTSNIKPTVSITDATLVHSGNVEAVTQRVYDYYDQRYLQKMKLFAPEVEIGQVVLVDTLYNQQLNTVIEKMSIDLSGGMVASVEATGVVVV
jgi:hypothetical protein